jgi:hypothetical protein
MQQLSLRDWPDGLEEDALQLALAPEEITRRSNISFEMGRDSLDEFQGAIVDLGKGKSLAFQRHLHSPTPGTTVLLRRGSADELIALRNMLALERSEITWTAPHLQTQLASVFRQRRPSGLLPAPMAEDFDHHLDELMPEWEAAYGRRAASRIRRVQVVRAVVGYYAHQALNLAERIKRIFSSAS